MKTIMAAKSPHDSSFSFSRRYFHWKKKPLDEDEHDDEEFLNLSSSSSHMIQEVVDDDTHHDLTLKTPQDMKKKPHFSKSKFKSALTVFTKRPSLHHHHHHTRTLGTRVVGTLFGHRRGHVHFALQEDPKLVPAFLVQLATPTSVLVREMASGLVRIALECEKNNNNNNKVSSNNNNTNEHSNPFKKKGCCVTLLEETLWRTYCNGRKCGYANRRECGPEEWRILKAVEPISMGAGVLPACGNGAQGSEEGEVMYMRAKYERVVGSRDSEAFYMLNPDANGGPELSIYLIRV